MLNDVAVLALAALRSNDHSCGGGSGLEVCESSLLDACSVMRALRFTRASVTIRDVPALQLLLDYPLARGLSSGSPPPPPFAFVLG